MTTSFNLCCGIKGLGAIQALSLALPVPPPPYGNPRLSGWHPWNRSLCHSLIDELWRVTKPGGVVCWVEGDAVMAKYHGYSGESYRNVIHFLDLGFEMWDRLA